MNHFDLAMLLIEIFPQFEETFKGKNLQHGDAFVREFEHIPEHEISEIDNAWDYFDDFLGNRSFNIF